MLPESPRWYLRKGQPQAAVDIVNRIISRSGNRVPPLTVEALGDSEQTAREELPPYWALFARGQLRWTTVGILSGVCAGTAYFLISVLLPKALNDQGFAVQRELGIDLDRLCGELLREGFHRLPDGDHRAALDDRLCAHRIAAGPRADAAVAPRRGLCGRGDGGGRADHRLHGAVGLHRHRVYLSEQFPTALRGRGQIFGESFGRLFAGVLAPFLMEPHTGSAPIFFGTIFVVVAIGAFIPLVFGRETVGQLETVTEGVPALA